MIRHHHKFRNCDIIIDFRDFFDAMQCKFSDFRQFHPTINHIAKIQIMVFRAKGHEIPSAIVIVPCGTRRFPLWEQTTYYETK